VVEQRRRVGGVVGHLVGTVGDRAGAEPALVVHERVEVAGEQLDEQLGRRDRCARTVEEQQPRAFAPTLVVHLDVVHERAGHGSQPKPPERARRVWPERPGGEAAESGEAMPDRRTPFVNTGERDTLTAFLDYPRDAIVAAGRIA
jgi:hypothetical protein